MVGTGLRPFSLNGVTQLHHVASALGKVHHHRVHLLDGSQQRGLPLSYQSPFRHLGFANTATNRGNGVAVTHIDLSIAQRSTCYFHIRCRSTLGCLRCHKLLFADRVGFHQGFVTGYGIVGLG